MRFEVFRYIFNLYQIYLNTSNKHHPITLETKIWIDNGITFHFALFDRLGYSISLRIHFDFKQKYLTRATHLAKNNINKNVFNISTRFFFVAFNSSSNQHIVRKPSNPFVPLETMQALRNKSLETGREENTFPATLP